MIWTSQNQLEVQTLSTYHRALCLIVICLVVGVLNFRLNVLVVVTFRGTGHSCTASSLDLSLC